jgi:dCTP deaminase
MIKWPSLKFPAINLWSAPVQNKNGLLSYNELCELVEQGVINAPMENVNGTSIDITLHHVIRRERIGSNMGKVRLFDGESIETEEINLFNGFEEYTLMPDAVILAGTNEIFDMPLNISAEYSLKSSIGRNFLNHQLAGWIDPGFYGALTLELKNDNQFHKLIIAPGMKIGQVKFFRHEPVPAEHSYAAKGRYNGHDKVAPSKGVL